MPGTLVGNGLLPLPLKISASTLIDGTDIVTVLGLNSQMYVYRIINNVPTLIGSSNGQGKCDSGSTVVKPNGDVILYVSQADNVAGSSGSTCKVYTYTFPLAVPPQSVSSSVDNYARSKIAAIQLKLGEAADV